ncbi:MAG: sigma-70 family RNA polymerase sigma factor [Gammaproteobacteria bacterium]|nr:sigma-70 family RNA polymerase sigma factor [Gammaproteobacteria bacterium]
MSDQIVDFEVLMQQALQGDQRAYTDLLQATVRLLRPYLAKRLSFTAETDDLMQEILISIHKARHTYNSARPYKPWVYAIARFRLQDYLRVHYADRLHHALALSEVENYFPQDVTPVVFSYESISGEIAKLPPKQAAILKMMHHEGATAKETAQKIGMQVSAVKVAAHRAYKILRAKLERI